MTLPLVQKLYAELDPHKKGYVTFNDWQNALQAFNYSDQTIIELKNSVQCAFADCESAFQFFLSFKSNSDLKKKTINRVDFEKAINWDRKLLEGYERERQVPNTRQVHIQIKFWQHLILRILQSVWSKVSSTRGQNHHRICEFIELPVGGGHHWETKTDYKVFKFIFGGRL